MVYYIYCAFLTEEKLKSLNTLQKYNISDEIQVGIGIIQKDEHPFNLPAVTLLFQKDKQGIQLPCKLSHELFIWSENKV